MSKRTITICDNCGNQLGEYNYSKKGKDFCSDECREDYFLKKEEEDIELEQYIREQKKIKEQPK